MHEINRARERNELRLRNSVDLCPVEGWAVEPKLHRAEVDIVLVDTQDGIVTKAGASRMIEVSGIDLENHASIQGGKDGNVEMRGITQATTRNCINGKNGEEEGMC